MSIIYTSSSTPKSLADLENNLASEGGLQGLMNKTINHSLLKTSAFELCLITPPDGQRHYTVEYFCTKDNVDKVFIANNYHEAKAFIATLLEDYHAAA